MDKAAEVPSKEDGKIIAAEKGEIDGKHGEGAAKKIIVLKKRVQIKNDSYEKKIDKDLNESISKVSYTDNDNNNITNNSNSNINSGFNNSSNNSRNSSKFHFENNTYNNKIRNSKSASSVLLDNTEQTYSNNNNKNSNNNPEKDLYNDNFNRIPQEEQEDKLNNSNNPNNSENQTFVREKAPQNKTKSRSSGKKRGAYDKKEIIENDFEDYAYLDQTEDNEVELEETDKIGRSVDSPKVPKHIVLKKRENRENDLTNNHNNISENEKEEFNSIRSLNNNERENDKDNKYSDSSASLDYNNVYNNNENNIRNNKSNKRNYRTRNNYNSENNINNNNNNNGIYSDRNNVISENSSMNNYDSNNRINRNNSNYDDNSNNNNNNNRRRNPQRSVSSPNSAYSHNSPNPDAGEEASETSEASEAGESDQQKEKRLLNKLTQFIQNFERWQYNIVFAKYLNIDSDLISYDLIKKFEDELKADRILLRDLALDLHDFYPKLKSFRRLKRGALTLQPAHRNSKHIFLNKLLNLSPLFDGIIKEDIYVDNFVFFEPLAQFIRENINMHRKNIEVSKKVLNFNKPENFFPLARKMKRKFVYHMGPTNSGKTSNALERLAQAKSGIYLAPLRLLAWEIYEKLAAKSVKCTLLTGQDRIFTDNETHYSMTIEKCDFRRKFEVAVIDEIQMIEDYERGSAWTNAVLGVQADEVHLCGDERGLHLLKQLCEKTGDELFYKRYSRFSNLIVEQNTFDYADLRKGDCVIAFAKVKIMEIKRRIVEAKNGDIDSCAVIYGDLPSETKKDQARMFNELTFSSSHQGEVKYDYLVASDAVYLFLKPYF